MAGMPPDNGNARIRAAALAAGAGLAAAHTLPPLAKPVPGVAALFRIATRAASGDGVALTFDDGPHARGTVAVLETLRDHAARATFFLVGEQVVRRPSLAAEIAAEGHGIALHCDRHRNMLRLSPRQVRDDLARANDRIVSATGVVPNLHRAPYGVYSAVALWVVRTRGLRPLLWTHAGHDWSGRATPESILRELASDLGPGSVLLLHDGDAYSSEGSWRNTAAALPELLERIHEAGFAHIAP
jgi:peptidoglycan/xylan/chitin deacetylase (PgdA/CDA1 family)